MPGSIQIGYVDVNKFYWCVYQLVIFKSLQLAIFRRSHWTWKYFWKFLKSCSSLIMMRSESQYSVVPQFQGRFRLIPYESQGNQIFSDVIFLFSHAFFGCKIWMNCNLKNYEINVSAQEAIWISQDPARL